MDNTRGQLTTNHPIPFLMTLASDHATPATGLSPALIISKDGSIVFNKASGAVVEMASGLYSWQGSAWDRDTIGSLSMIATATAVDNAYKEINIVPYDPYLVFPAQNAGISGGLPRLDGGPWIQANVIAVSGLLTGAGPSLSGFPVVMLTGPEEINISNQLLDLVNGVETNWTPRQLLRELLAGAVGNVNLNPVVLGVSGTVTIKNPAGTKNRVIASCDASGNRTVNSFDVS